MIKTASVDELLSAPVLPVSGFEHVARDVAGRATGIGSTASKLSRSGSASGASSSVEQKSNTSVPLGRPLFAMLNREQCFRARWGPEEAARSIKSCPITQYGSNRSDGLVYQSKKDEKDLSTSCRSKSMSSTSGLRRSRRIKGRSASSSISSGSIGKRKTRDVEGASQISLNHMSVESAGSLLTLAGSPNKRCRTCPQRTRRLDRTLSPVEEAKRIPMVSHSRKPLALPRDQLGLMMSKAAGKAS
mmetsp:Transcript_3836/g.5441  ORF Transcript_3836/g.5441 Transcript_3836/m.5441 type:complete len:245 (-) Transcript_3836:440-1174(-)|eukprot:CAMPEP_0184486720 /NCGR_PEP_ID=MMETSP0113_2-20130426/8394_1 /TAXON_ID=91329 /ORGANISM="Norrisiella sphaerica, Strain BC52" /LENGTH=244 /DNA_ID=CAMNT_0026868729 /DNA_START=127 /DNA_END=861 /DNA_ORIENTATION=+